MIKLEEARTEIKKVTGKEAARQIKTIIEQYNIYIVNDGDVIATKKKRNMDNLVWFNDLSGCLMSRQDLFDSVSKGLDDEGIFLSENDFCIIDNDISLSRFDLPTAFHIICRKMRDKAERELLYI